MKKGDKVRCVGLSDGTTYLTVGREYVITAAAGDMSSMHGVIEGSCDFEIINDFGRFNFCIYPECAHGEWEVGE